jgi:hypothetical protein
VIFVSLNNHKIREEGKKKKIKQGGVSHNGALPFTLKKKYLIKAKEEELWKLKYLAMQKNIIFKKIL